MTDQAGPSPPDFAAVGVEELGPDGSRWRWTGDRWVQVAPAGTFAAEVAFEDAVVRTLDTAFQGIRAGQAQETIVERLRQTSGHRTVLEAAAARSGKMRRHPWAGRVQELLRAAVDNPTG
jgi:hypothetical protein